MNPKSLWIVCVLVELLAGVARASPTDLPTAPNRATTGSKPAATVPTPSCEYGCEDYQLDALICINHEQYRCAPKRLWSKTGKRC